MDEGEQQMTMELVLQLAREAMLTALLVSAPMLTVALVVGLIVSIIQTTTSVQEQTLTFVPKIVAVLMAIGFFGPWMIGKMTDYITVLYTNLTMFVH